MNYGDIITIHFRKLEEYVAHGLITRGQRAEIERYHMQSTMKTGMSAKQERSTIQREHIITSLLACKGNRKLAAKMLMMSERTLYRLIVRYDITGTKTENPQ